MSSSKFMTCKGTFRPVFLSEFIDWSYNQSCRYFRPSFVNCCPSTLLSGSTLPPSLGQSTVYTDSVWLGGGVGGVELCWRPCSASECNTLFLTRFRTYKIARPPKAKTWEERGPQTDKHMPQSPFTFQFF